MRVDDGAELALVVFVGLLGMLFAIPVMLLTVLYYAAKTNFTHFEALAQALGLGGGPSVPVEQPKLARTADGSEPAYRQYLFAQARNDVRGALSAGVRSVGYGARLDLTRLCEQWQDEVLEPRNLWRRIVLFMLVAGLAAGTLLGLGVILLFTAVQIIVLTVIFGFALAGILVLRSIDSLLLQLRGVRIVCPTCGEHVPYPSYTCNACHALHRDVRPGRYGVLRRACACGEYRMPTLLLLGSHRMDAYCSNEGCERRLGEHTGTAAEAVIPISGDRNAGKTRLMAAMVVTLTDPARASSVMRFADQKDDGAQPSALQHRFAELRQALVEDQPTRPTVAQLQAAYSLRGRTGSGLGVVHLFDTAGERFHNSDRIRELRYLRESRSFLFVLDPFSIDSVWNNLRPEEQERLRPFRASARPILVYGQMLEIAREMGVEPAKARLAVAVTKSDLLRGTSFGHRVPAAENAAVLAWLDDLELDDLVRSARLQFAQTRFFLTSATLIGGQVDQQVRALAEWILAGGGLSLRAGLAARSA